MFLKAITLLLGMMLLPQHVNLELSEFRWKNRILLIFSVSEGVSHLSDQKELLLRDKAGLLDRDLLIFEITKGQEITELIHETKHKSASDLWQSFGVSTSDFTVLLIGKDGTEKLRSYSTISSKELYAVIDAMPMRRSEMRKYR
jgi:hypothetical protein